MKLRTEKELRAQLKLRSAGLGSQRELAGALGISEQHLANVLNGKRPITAALALKMGFKRVIAFQGTRSKQATAAEDL